MCMKHILYICCIQLSLAKNKGEILGIMVMDSGYGSALPTPVIAHLSKTGSAVKSGQLNIGDHIIAINDMNMVGMPVKVCIEQLKVSGLAIHSTNPYTVFPSTQVIMVQMYTSKYNTDVCLYVAQPTLVGAWLMALGLQRHIEYYYYLCVCTLCNIMLMCL